MIENNNVNETKNNVCEKCNGTGKRILQGIEIHCSCKGLELYGNDIVGNVTNDIDSSETEVLSSLHYIKTKGFYTEYSNLPELDLYTLSEDKQAFAAVKNFDIVGLDYYLKMCNSLLEKSKNGELLKSSVLLSASNGFALDLVAKHIVQNYRVSGLEVPDVTTCVDLIIMRHHKMECWLEFLNAKVVVLKLAGNDIDTLFNVMFQVLEMRSLKGLATILISNLGVFQLVEKNNKVSRGNYVRVLGMLDTSLEDPYNTVVSVEVYYKPKVKEEENDEYSEDFNGGKIK